MKFLNKGEKLIKKSNTIKLKNSEIILFKGFNNINKDIEELNEEETLLILRAIMRIVKI